MAELSGWPSQLWGFHLLTSSTLEIGCYHVPGSLPHLRSRCAKAGRHTFPIQAIARLGHLCAVFCLIHVFYGYPMSAARYLLYDVDVVIALYNPSTHIRRLSSDTFALYCTAISSDLRSFTNTGQGYLMVPFRVSAKYGYFVQ